MIKKTSLLILFTIQTFSMIHAQELTVATFNLRYSIEKNHKFDSTRGEDWQRRGPVAAALTRFHEFEIFGVQEALLHQLEDFSDWLPDFSYVGVGRDDGKKADHNRRGRHLPHRGSAARLLEPLGGEERLHRPVGRAVCHPLAILYS